LLRLVKSRDSEIDSKCLPIEESEINGIGKRFREFWYIKVLQHH
jgi:hypothetical protein